MRCICPKSIIDPRYHDPKRRLSVPCGTCYACLSRRRQDWVFRLKQEFRKYPNACFVTLTYDNENMPLAGDGVPVVFKRDVQLFLKRLRKSLKDKKIRYFCVSEYGVDFLRPHYHAIIFNLSACDNSYNLIKAAWQKGFICVDKVTDARISYVAKYCLSYGDGIEKFEKEFMLCSRRPAIGSSYLSESMKNFYKSQQSRLLVSEDGFVQNMPRYYFDKIFSDNEKKLYSFGHVCTYLKRKLTNIKRTLSMINMPPKQDFLQCINCG